MAPSSTAVTGVLRQVIHYHLDNHAADNALFFAERLSAQDSRSSESAHLLALCHLRLGDSRSAYEVSKPMGYRGINLGCAWVFAQACLTLERYKDGIAALEKSRGLWSLKNSLGKHSATTRAAHPDASAILCLLGKLYREYDKKKAIVCFEDALKLSPFMWDAFAALCDMGVNVRVPNIFRTSEALLRSFDLDYGYMSDFKENIGPNPLEPVPKKASSRTFADTNDPFNLQRSATYQDVSFGSNNLYSPDLDGTDFMAKISAARRPAPSSNSTAAGSEGMETPTGPSNGPDVPARSGLGPEPPHAPARKMRTAQAADAGLADPPPRITYRLGGGSKRNTRAQDKGQPEQAAEPMSEASNTTLPAAVRPAVQATERKRTVSGHPVNPRTTTSDDPPQRRSARLNMFKPPTRANTGTVTTASTATATATAAAAAAAVAAPRELKKARPQISKIMRPVPGSSSVGRVVSGNRKPVEDTGGMDVDQGEALRVKEGPVQQAPLGPMAPSSRPTAEAEAARIEEALKWILDLAKRMGAGYYALSRFRCGEALQAYGTLPKSQLETPWVQAQLGRLHYEQASYAEAEKFFRRVRVLAPTRMDDMEIYSTILWHLKRETDLSFLAHELIDSAWFSPQAWCAVGNAWSLNKDHEQAIRCFKRATQLAPDFAYAYTLQGHEHVANEEYEKALAAYRQAIAADRRHYNAYYGIGRVYERLGNYDKAYLHFHAASVINPTNAVLVCWIGTVLEKQKQIMPALGYFTKAAELAPRAAQTRYKRARALMAVGNLDAAQKELMLLKDLAPDEARVHFLLGKLYRAIGEKQSAVRHFSNALALDPKAAQQIKEAIESFEDDIGMDDSIM